MDREDLRPAKFNAYYNGEDVVYSKEKDGYFHRWADDAFADNTDKYHQRVVGIIEAIDGGVYKVPPESITLFPVKNSIERLREESINVLKNLNRE